MIVITNHEGRTLHVEIRECTVFVAIGGRDIAISRDDARQLRRFLEALG